MLDRDIFAKIHIRGLNRSLDDGIDEMNMHLSELALLEPRDSLTEPGAHEPDNVLVLAGLILNIDTRRVYANGQKIALGPTEFRLLQFFIQYPEIVHSRSSLLRNLWGKNVVVGLRTIDVHIRRLRQAMEPAQVSGLLQTVRGRGYRISHQT